MSATATATTTPTQLDQELDRQIETLVAIGFPERLGMSGEEFAAALAPLRLRVLAGGLVPEVSASRVPFLIVPGSEHIAADDLVGQARLVDGSAPGFVDRNHGERGLAAYEPLPELLVPAGPFYLATNIERGEEFCGVAPIDALPALRRRRRTPLTIHEGLALVLHHPAALEKNRCFSLAGSRRGDKRVPALWIADKAPKLGWCWEGNPHSWLGVASAGERIATAQLP